MGGGGREVETTRRGEWRRRGEGEELTGEGREMRGRKGRGGGGWASSVAECGGRQMECGNTLEFDAYEAPTACFSFFLMFFSSSSSFGHNLFIPILFLDRS